MRLAVLAVFAATGCGGPSAEAPLTISLGITHEKAEAELRAHQYCREPGSSGSSEALFPRCDRTASEVADSWVTAIFEGDALVELRRWERYPDDNRAVERWNELVGARMKRSPASDEAGKLVKLQPGTRTMKAFREGDVAIGVYLLTPSAPENANVLERLILVR